MIRFLCSVWWRMNRRAQPALTLLTVGAVAASAALGSGLEMASRSVQSTLRASTTALLGRAPLQVTGTKRGLPERLIDEVGSIPGVVAAEPVISETFRLTESALPLYVLGLDLETGGLDEEDSREIRIYAPDPLLLIGNSDAVILSETLMRRLGLTLGDALAVRGPVGEHRLHIEGLIRPGDLADAYGGQVALMDVWSLQSLLGAQGWIDRLRVHVAADADVDAVTARIAERLGGIAEVQRTEELRGRGDQTLGLLTFTASGVTLLGVVIASLLAHAAISYVALGRAQEFARMRCLGLDGRGVAFLIGADALILSALGVALGLPAGVLLSPSLVGGFSRLSEYVGHVHVEGSELGLSTLLLVTGIWLSVSCLGAGPALRGVLRQDPLQALDMTRAPQRGTRGKAKPALLGAAALSAGLALCLLDLNLPAGLRLASLLVLGLGACVVASGHWFLRLVHASRGGLGRTSSLGECLGSALIGSPASAAIPIGVVAAIVCSLTLLDTVLHSLTESANEWGARNHPGAAAVRAGEPAWGAPKEPIRPETIELVRSTPGVEDVGIYFMLHPTRNAEEIVLGALSIEVFHRRGALEHEDTPAAELAAAMLRGEVAISHGFQHHFGVSVGERIELRTRHGPRSFRVGGLIKDYSGPAGSVFLDVATFDRYFHRSGAHSLVLWASEPFPLIQERLGRATRNGQALFLYYGERLQRAASRVYARFSRLLGLLLGICACLSAIALLILLSGGVTRRRRELGLMALAGATPANVTALVLAEIAAVSLTGIGLGVALGLAGGTAAADLLFERFGWVVEYRVDPGSVGITALGALLVPLAVGGLPAWLGQRALPMSVLNSARD